MAFTLKFLDPVFRTTYINLLNAIPGGSFINTKFTVVPRTFLETNFQLETDNLNVPVKFFITTEGSDKDSNRSRDFAIVPINKFTTVPIKLSQGVNIIRVLDETNDSDFTFIVNSTEYAKLILNYAREIYNNSEVLFDLQNRNIFSAVSTRIAEQLLKDYDKFIPDIQSLQILASKLIIKSLVSQGGSDKAVTEFLTGITNNTPIKEVLQGLFDIDIDTDKLVNYQENLSGFDFHTWIPDFSAARFKSFIKLIENLKNTSLISVNDREVQIDKEGTIERHLFKERKHSFLERQEDDSGFENLRIKAKLNTKVDMFFQMAQYVFDLFITDKNLLGINRGTLDKGEGFEFDSNLNFDLDPIDPFHDGFIGLKLTGRFDNEVMDTSTETSVLGFDTMIQKDRDLSVPERVYQKGFYTQVVQQRGVLKTILSPILATGDFYIVLSRDSFDIDIPFDVGIPFDEDVFSILTELGFNLVKEDGGKILKN